MATYHHATCTNRGTDHDAGSIFLHAGDGPDGTYTWQEIVATAREWGEVVENDEPTLTVRIDDADDGIILVDVDAVPAG